MQGNCRGMRSLWVVLIFAVTLGCVTANPAGQQAMTETPTPPTSENITSGPSPAAPPTNANQIVNVNVSEQADEIVVSILGNGAFVNYQFQRTGDREFHLDLADIDKDSPRPPLPAASEKVRLGYRDLPSGKGIQLLGTLRSPLDRYFLSNFNNGLLLRLSLAGPPPVPQTVAPRAERPSPALAKAQPKLKSDPGLGSITAATPPPRSLPQVEQGASLKKSFSGKPISLDLLDADVKNVLRLIADITGTNMVIEPDVTGQVTLKVEQVPWDQVLDLILAMNNLGKDQVGNIIRIATRNKLRQEWKEQEEAIKARQQLLEAAKDYGDMTTEYLAVNYAKPAELAAKINEIKSDKGKISVDERTSLIIYTDYPTRMQNAKVLISRLDKPTPQVMIEARIAQISRNASREFGVTWNFNLVHTTGSGSHEFTQDFAVNESVSNSNTFGFSWAQLTGQTLWNVDLTLSAIETSGEGRVISAPRVMTLDNVKAMIKQGTQIPYLVLSDQNVSSTELVDAVLELEVTPHITPDNKVRMEIKAKKDSPDFSNPVGVQSQPPIDTREVRTELLVDDGAVIVIGGIIENSKERSEEGVPGLSSVPLLGWLFRKNSVKIDKTELLIFICPKIVGLSPPPQSEPAAL